MIKIIFKDGGYAELSNVDRIIITRDDVSSITNDTEDLIIQFDKKED